MSISPGFQTLASVTPPLCIAAIQAAVDGCRMMMGSPTAKGDGSSTVKVRDPTGTRGVVICRRVPATSDWKLSFDPLPATIMAAVDVPLRCRMVLEADRRHWAPLKHKPLLLSRMASIL